MKIGREGVREGGRELGGARGTGGEGEGRRGRRDAGKQGM